MNIVLTDEEIKKIAFLARIQLTDEEILDYKKKLSPIIKIAQELKEVDTANIATTDGVRSFRISNLREDFPVLDSLDQNLVANYQRIRKNILHNFKSKYSQNNYNDLLSLPGIFAES